MSVQFAKGPSASFDEDKKALDASVLMAND